MWPFRKATETEPTEPTEPKEPKEVAIDPVDATQEKIDRLREWREIGETFNYLGRICVVTGHYRNEVSRYLIYRIPCINADYADENGIIRNIRFTIRQIEGLKRQQQSNS